MDVPTTFAQESLRDEILVPVPRGPVPSPVRVTGPGRLERGYRARIDALEDDLARRERALACAALVERGQSRLLDRLETEIERGRAEVVDREQREKRLVLALGALQRENEMLRAASRPAPRLRGKEERARPWWRRIAERLARA